MMQNLYLKRIIEKVTPSCGYKTNPIQTQYSKFSILNSKFCILSLCLRCVVEGTNPISLDFLVKRVYVYFRTAIHISRNGRFNMNRRNGFTLIELLVVIAIIAVLMAILMPSLQAAKRLASSSACLSNEKTLLTAWIMYADDNDGLLVSNRACYDTATDKVPWVHRPKDISGNDLAYNPAPSNITKEDRFRGIMAGALWEYVKDVDAYHCPGDIRKSTRKPPRDCWRSYSISYAFGFDPIDQYQGQAYRKMQEIRYGALYYVFVEEEHNGSRYGENEGGWHLLGRNLMSPGSWAFYDPLASYHLKSSTFGFADGHARRRKWMDKRTLEFIRTNAEDPSSHSGISTSSPNNEDLRWLIEHFWSKDRVN
jgi:prepilin-type N-terminal cleavage/methylation domain-containing protein